MSDPVNVTALQKAQTAWRDALPDWVRVLAEEAARASMGAVAKRIGYSTGVVSAVIANKYRGDLGAVEARVRGALLSEEVECPVLGPLLKNRCLDEQKKAFTGTSALRTRIYNACRNGCVHSRLTKGGSHAVD
jgi:hypothetical protein